MPGPLAHNRLVSLPYLDLGGELASDPEAAAALRAATLELARRTAVSGVELRGGAEHGAATRRHRFLLPLPPNREELSRAVGPKVRNQIRKAERSGLDTRAAESAELPFFYRVFARNMRDLGSPVHSIRFFFEILDRFAERACLYLTLDANRRPVAGALALRWEGTLTVPWASSLRSARPSCPNHSLYWRILRDAQEAGLERFDFGRSSLGSGTYHFKKQWGGEIVPLVWTVLDRRGEPCPEDHLSPDRHRLLAALWRRLPLAVANRLGPPIRGRLPH